MNIAGPHLDAELFAGHGRKKLSMNLTTHAFQPEVQTTKQKSRSRDSNPQAQNTEAVMLTVYLVNRKQVSLGYPAAVGLTM